ncbi:hypothetical protein HUU53_03030 [Candidatus Micrarchaeota archaeon]|nr:hypothetical protein [Candidatus Micrarchaeota archaeon]
MDKFLAAAGFLAVAGTLFLTVFEQENRFIETPVKELNSGLLNQNVLLTGLVFNPQTKAGVFSFKLCQENDCVPVVFFSLRRVSLVDSGDWVTVLGKVSEYNGELQVIGDSLE